MTLYTGNTTTTTPTINTATSTQVLAANTSRKFLRIQNSSAANIGISIQGDALTGIVPTVSNKCLVLSSTAGANVFQTDPMFVPQGAVTVYQTSGGAINTVVVTEG